MISVVALTASALAAADEAGVHKSTPIWQDSSFYVLIAFVIVVVVLARAGLHKMMISGLDKRSQKIADELDEARRMREEAQELLAQFQRRQREAENEAAAIIDLAKKDAKRIAQEAREKINEQMERRTRAAEEKIARAEEQAIAEVRGQTADLAVAAAREIIRDRMDSGAQTAFVDRAIAGLRVAAER